MLLRVVTLACVLLLAGAAGWLASNRFADRETPEETPDTRAVVHVDGRVAPSTAQPIHAEPLMDLATVEQSANTIEPGIDAEAGVLMQLQEELERETTQRRLLERRLHELADKVAKLEQVVPREKQVAGAQAAVVRSESRDAAVEAQTRAERRVARFLAAGFSAEETRDLTRRMEEVEMDQLYLRDRASREGWLRTPEYRNARNDLRNRLLEEMGEEAYDRFLYATEQSNRVLVDSVLDNSPAQDIGLESGDIIRGYGDKRVFSFRDIRRESQQGTAGDSVALRVERDGEILELEIPRGPLGVRLNSLSVGPDQEGMDTTSRRRRSRRF